jgi:hypothetical protein
VTRALGGPAIAALLLAILRLAAPHAARAADVRATDLLGNPARYAGQVVTIRGTMGTARPVGPRSPTTAFDLFDGPGMVRVVSKVLPACVVGTPVTVEGRFAPALTVEGTSFFNVVEAFVVACR